MADETTPAEGNQEPTVQTADEGTTERPSGGTDRPTPSRPPRRGGGGPRGGPSQRPERRGRFRPRRKVCSFCVDKVQHIEYKNVDALRRFVDGHGKIIPRRKTGTCAKHQRRLALAIKRARHLALLPYAAGRNPYQ